MIEEGSPAPDFELQTDTGETVRLSALRGKPVVLYFYPKDHTSGCTPQARESRVAWGLPSRLRAAVPAARRPRPQGCRGLRRLEREVALRAHLHGDRPL